MDRKPNTDDAMAAIELALNKINQRLDRQYDETVTISRRLTGIESRLSALEEARRKP
jgi:hypothetical protein